MAIVQLFQPVRLRVDMPEAGLRRGAAGRVLDLFDDDPQHVEVEFHKPDGSEHGLYVEQIVQRADLEVLPPEQESPRAETTEHSARQDDVEVYLRNCAIERAIKWVKSSTTGALDGPKDIDGAVALYPSTGAIILTPKIEDGPWLSVWFNTLHRPWDTDADCARSAAAELDCVVRCDPGESHPGLWLELEGPSERLVEWP